MSLEEVINPIDIFRKDLKKLNLRNPDNVAILIESIKAFCNEYIWDYFYEEWNYLVDPGEFLDGCFFDIEEEGTIVTLCEEIVKKVEKCFPLIEENHILEEYLRWKLGGEAEKPEEGEAYDKINLINISIYLEREIMVLLWMYFWSHKIKKIQPVFWVFERNIQSLFEYFDSISQIVVIHNRICMYISENKITRKEVEKIIQRTMNKIPQFLVEGAVLNEKWHQTFRKWLSGKENVSFFALDTSAISLDHLSILVLATLKNIERKIWRSTPIISFDNQKKNLKKWDKK